MSVFALASVLSLALLRSFGPVGSITHVEITESESPDHTDTDAVSLPSLTAKTFSIWDHLVISSPGPISQEADPSSEAPVAKQSIPDLKLIKLAISTFSSSSSDGASSAEKATISSEAPKVTAESVTQPRPKRRVARPSTSCCSLSIRDSDVGLSTMTTALTTIDGTWSRNWRHKLLRVQMNTSVVDDLTTPIPACPCDLSRHIRSQMISRFGNALGSTSLYVISAARYLDHVYKPALVELQNELGELLSLVQVIAETTATLSQLILNRAARGVSVSRRALDGATSALRRHVPRRPVINTALENEVRTMTQEAIAITRANIDNLSEYMEDQATTLSKLVDEHTVHMQEKGIKSLKQAKKGLDKLIHDVKRMTGESDEEKSLGSDVGNAGPMLSGQGHKREARSPTSIPSRLHRRYHSNRTAEKHTRRPYAPPEIPSRRRRLLEMMHHVSRGLRSMMIRLTSSKGRTCVGALSSPYLDGPLCMAFMRALCIVFILYPFSAKSSCCSVVKRPLRHAVLER